MSKTKGDRLHNQHRREERKKNNRFDHILQLKEKRVLNALRSNDIDEILSFDEFTKR
mgnify:CR=1 FL=1